MALPTALGLALVMILAACGSSGSSSAATTLNMYIFPENSGALATAISSCNKASNGEYNIKYNILPNGADDQRQQLVRRLAAKDSTLDILGLDVVWPAEFSEAGWIEPFPAKYQQEVQNGTLAAAYNTGVWNGKLVAAPLNTNTQLLWYRKDLVKTPPTTWNEMLQDSAQLAKEGKPHLVEVQGAQYEGLTVLFNTLVASAGGSILTSDSKQVSLGAPADKAAQALSDLGHSVAADPSWSTQMEDANRLAFENGNAAFELNYPFIYPSALTNNPSLAKNIGWAQYPSLVDGQSSHVTIGGNDLAVSTYSKHKTQSFDAIMCLRNRQNQLNYAIKGGLPPTLESLYTDPALVNGGYPFAAAIFTSLKNASVRPKTPAYQSVSLQVSYNISPPASASAAKVKALSKALKDALQSKGVVP